MLEDWSEFTKFKEKYSKLLVIAVSDPQSLSLLNSPGDLDCDVYVGEGQSLGNYLSFGGPYIGLFAAKQKYARKMPGRIIGRTEDIDGKEGFVIEAVGKMVKKRINKRYRPIRKNLIKHKQNLMEDFEKMIHNMYKKYSVFI